MALKSLFEKILISSYKDKNFLREKWEYYSAFSYCLALFGSVSSLAYLFSDAQLFGRFPYETLFPRLIIILPLFLYLRLCKTSANTTLLSFLTLLMCHCIQWCTLWASYYLPDYSLVGEGFVVIHLLFFGASFGTPFVMYTVMHLGLLLNIYVSDLICNWGIDLEKTMVFNVPCILGVIMISYVMDKIFEQHYKLQQELKRVLVTDALTGVFNRHKLDQISYRGKLQLKEDTDKVCVLIMDIDYFKSVNDTYGHEEGDHVLVYAAKQIQTCLADEDILVRWGGEEFVVLLYKKALYQAVAIAEKIRATIAAGDSGVCPLTLSLGVTEYKKGTAYGEAIDKADEALYKAKDSGRNRTYLNINGVLVLADDYLRDMQKLQQKREKRV